MNDTAKQVMARLTDKGIICPDCNKVCTDILVEKFAHRLFRIDLKAKVITEKPDSLSWEMNDWAYHCPHCDSLNIDQVVREAKLEMQSL